MNESIYRKEHWSGDSRDGSLVNGDGFHIYKIMADGLIIDAYELYEKDDGEEVASPMPEMKNVNWLNDLGFENLNDLDEIDEREFRRVIKLTKNT